MRPLLFRTALLLLILSTPTPAQQFQVRKVADGIYTALPPHDQRFDQSNAAIVVLDEGVLVVDTHTSPQAAGAVIAEIRKLTPKPVRWVLNTHWHGDHVQGNAAYHRAFTGVKFLAHTHTREDIERRAIPSLKEDTENIAAWLERAKKALETGEADGKPITDDQRKQISARIERNTRRLEDLRGVGDFVLPGETFTDSMTLTSGREVRLLHFPGHTRGDVVVFLPNERVLITGDLLDDLPFTGHGSPRRLTETLRAFTELDFGTIIPGHGAVRTGEEARAHLRKVLELFDSIVQQTEAAAETGLNIDEAKKKVDVTALRSHFVTDDVSARYWDFFVAEAIARAHEQFTEK